ncbi:DUF2071 domain-containing protein [Bacillus sp. DTU_2020_1000418_1_SI_GHA_SEK_038]|uniref:YqjF family protein n=1 Tax=Bacillus sp. DTU_2020_1000418_1_SI_GHA_SEK_038 TaxID=3077585 RepID=UPI0028E8C5BD|nr:DUF2071 domain-containing protein [Bacillus sp. DTU_2020_1000418_1_SI_GHA_SEK_038]WNS76922.1 DUF2071 domain-containing protein [Bacillus sp. DTU_2020_1000418_1_SI_GHA_SEK_038]
MKLIYDNAHRPYPIPSDYWIMRQAWRNLLFIHWPISLEKVRQFVHPSLHIDTFDGDAWLGIIIFEMEGIYPRGFPSISIIPPFAEINVRTYVHYNGKPGIYFMSLDVGDLASLTIAKRWLHLPYKHSHISIQKIGKAFYYDSIRVKQTNPQIICKGSYSPVKDIFFPIEGTLDHWLTERYCFFSSNKRDNLYCCEIHHDPWPLQQAEAIIKKNTLFTPFQIDISDIQPIFHFSKGVDSLIWNIKKA